MKIFEQRTSLFHAALLLVISITGCSDKETSDAYGQFEATETTISSEASGKLMHFEVEAGDKLQKNQKVGIVDTTGLALQRKEFKAKLVSIQTKIANVNAQIDIQKEELSLARTHLNRIQAMFKDGAATNQQLDKAEVQVQVLEKKIEALQTQKLSIRADVNSMQKNIDQINNKIEDALIINPIKGTVLTSFAEPYEVVRQGQPLYQIADLDTLILQVYVSGAQLPHIKLGDEVQVLVDRNADENQSFRGKITWIANEAEFTPQQIQTKKERVTQVYAVEIRVPNRDGILKIGMPGEVNFSRKTTQKDT